MMTRFQIRFCFLVSLAFALTIRPLDAAPRRFSHWSSGRIVNVDTARDTSALRHESGAVTEVFTWDGATRFWDKGADAKSNGVKIMASTLVKGESVRVLYANEGNRRVAQRIIFRAGP